MKLIVVGILFLSAAAFTGANQWDSLIEGQQGTPEDSQIYEMYRDWLKFYGKEDLQAAMERFSIFKSKTLEVISFN